MYKRRFLFAKEPYKRDLFLSAPGGVVSVCGHLENRFAESPRLLSKSPRKICLFPKKDLTIQGAY